VKDRPARTTGHTDDAWSEGQESELPIARTVRAVFSVAQSGLMTAVYVASPLRFSEPGRHYLTSVLHPRLSAAGWEVLPLRQ
jgi:hypothetical protein